MFKSFPTVSAENPTISCFNCYQDLWGVDFFESDNAEGNGKFYVCCESCGHRTFFDFLGAENENLPKNPQ